MPGYDWEAEYFRVVEERDKLRAELKQMTTFRDNASQRLAWATEERDVARVERDALRASMGKSKGGGARATRIMRNARAKREAAG